MKLIIEDEHLGRENYECEIYIDKEKIDELLWDSDSNRAEIECPANSHIQVEFMNVIFKEQKTTLCTFMYWLLVLVTKYGEEHQFNIPFHALLIIESKGESDIHIKTNPFWKEKAFTIEGRCRVIENRYYVPDSFFLVPIKKGDI